MGLTGANVRTHRLSRKEAGGLRDPFILWLLESEPGWQAAAARGQRRDAANHSRTYRPETEAEAVASCHALSGPQRSRRVTEGPDAGLRCQS